MNFTNNFNRLRTVALGLLAAVFLLSSGELLAQTAYVSAGGSDVTVVDLATGNVVDNISLLGTPRNIVVSPAGDQLATLNDNSVSIIDPATNSVVNELNTTNFNFLGLRDAVFSADGSTLITIDVPTSLIITFDPATLAGPAGFASTAPGIGPASIALAPISGDAYTANAGTNDISPITVSGGTVTAGTPIPAGLAPQGIAFLPGQDIAYVANFNDNSVSKIDVAAGTTLATINGVNDPTRLAASPDGSVVLVLEENSASVAVIDVATDAVVTNIAVGNTPFGIDFTEDGSQAIVANQGDASLSVIDLATNTVVNTITGIGGAPSGIVVLGGAAQNEAPIADLVATPTSGDAPLTVDFDASGSTDDGTIVSFDYDFGNGTTGSGETTSTTYTEAGTFTVTLTVTDDEGATGTATVEITVTEPANEAPVADLVATPTSGDAPLTVDFDASGSTDSDGTIVSFDYDFGNGTTGSGETTSTTYTEAGTFTVTLTVIDDDGATGTTTVEITVTEPANAAPVADLVATPTSGDAPLTVSFDASGSSDSDGTIVSYDYDFGNGTTGSGETTSTTYPDAGSFTVTLTVTDDDGATATATETITVNDPVGGDLQAEIDAALVAAGDILNTSTIPVPFGGITAAVVTEDNTVLTSVFNNAGAGGRAFVPEDRIGLADVTQTVLAALTLALEAEGLLTLDQTVSDFVDASALTGVTGNETIQQLLSHTSGLQEFTDDANYEDFILDDPNTVFTAQALLAEFLADEPPVAPGTFSFANTNFLVLGLVLEAANGSPSLQQSIDGFISGPAGLTGLQLYDPVAGDPSNFAPLFANLSGNGFLVPLNPNISVFTGIGNAGNLLATPAEVVALARALDGTILTEADFQRLLNFIPSSGRIGDRYGLGLESFEIQLEDAAGQPFDQTVFGHTGSTNVVNYNTTLLYVPACDIAVFVGTNNAEVAPSDIYDLAVELLDLILDEQKSVGEPEAPTASFTATPDMGEAPLEVAFDASASSDPDGTIVSFAWDYGDGNTGTGEMSTNTYTAAGTYVVTLTVTDNDGLTGTATTTITVTEVANEAPTASFTATPDMGEAPLEVAFDASASSDPDGTIVSFAWDYGDGNTGTGEMSTNTYTAAGTYVVTLTVTDDAGATGTATDTIEVTMAGNENPVASFIATPGSGEAPLMVSFDASNSSDADGTIVEYAWDFGDGNTATGITASNTYTAAGNFVVTLTVTDDDGATATATDTIEVTASPVDGTIATIEGPAEVPMGCDFPILVTLNSEEIVGSFTATLTFDPAELTYVDGSATTLSDYDGVINDTDVANGVIIFNGVRVEGLTNLFDIFSARFLAVGPVGSTASVNISFSALASSFDFQDLLPGLTVENLTLEIVRQGLLGDVNMDGVVNSTDALIILTFEVGTDVGEPATTLIAEGFGDVNGDGLTNSTDALIILTFDAGLPVQFPVGEETCPDDATALGGLLTDPAPAAAPKSFGAAIDASFVPVAAAKAGEIVEVPVVVDMNGTGAALGSYGAQLRWNPEVYELVSYAGGTTEGFASPVMNVSETDAGKLAIAHAYVAGATGEVNVFNLRLLQKVDAPAAADLDLEFTSMAAAGTFETLAPRVNAPQVPTLELLPVKVFPNPFASELTVQFSLPAAADTEVAVFDATGRLVRTLVTGERTAGSHVVTWDGIGEGSVRASGVYLIKVVSGELEATRRVVLQ